MKISAVAAIIPRAKEDEAVNRLPNLSHDSRANKYAGNSTAD